MARLLVRTGCFLVVAAAGACSSQSSTQLAEPDGGGSAGTAGASGGTGGSGAGGTGGTAGTAGSGGSSGSGGSVAPNCDLEADFGDPYLLGGVNSPSNESGAWLTPTGDKLYFSSDRGIGDGGSTGLRIFEATSSGANGSFTNVKPLPGVVNALETQSFSLSADGQQLFVSQKAPASVFNLWVATKSSPAADFGNLAEVSNVNGGANDYMGSLAEDAGLFFFASTRNGAFSDIFVSKADTLGTFGAPTEQADLNSTDSDGGPLALPDGNTVYFSSNRLPPGKVNVFVARRNTVSQPFAVQPVTKLNSSNNDYAAYISPDGCKIIISSTRTGGAGSLDLYAADKPPK